MFKQAAMLSTSSLLVVEAVAIMVEVVPEDTALQFLVKIQGVEVPLNLLFLSRQVRMQSQ
jgi:hypothetical protein